MRAIALLFILLAAVAGGEPEIRFESVVRYRETVAGKKIEVAIHQRVVDFTAFKISGGSGKGPLMLDGLKVGGQDSLTKEAIGGWPLLETIAEIELTWDGKKIPVAKSLHLNLLNLSLRPDSIQFVPRPSGEELLIQATGGDGGGSYLVSLVLRQNGKHKQYETEYCESGIRSFPYEIECWHDAKGDDGPKIYSWLSPKEGEGEGGDKVVPAPLLPSP